VLSPFADAEATHALRRSAAVRAERAARRRWARRRRHGTQSAPDTGGWAALTWMSQSKTTLGCPL